MHYQYSEVILERIRDRAQVGATISEICIELGLVRSFFQEDLAAHDSPVWKAYNSGTLMAKDAINSKMLALARGGSGQAAKDALAALDFQHRKNFLDELRLL